MWMKKLLIAAGACLSVLFFGVGEAKADFLCSVNHNGASGTTGSEGSVFIIVHTAANCGGSVVASYFLCTTGATSSACPSSPGSRFERHGLVAQFQALQRAAATDQKILVFTGACNGGGSGCFSSMQYRSD